MTQSLIAVDIFNLIKCNNKCLKLLLRFTSSFVKNCLGSKTETFLTTTEPKGLCSSILSTVNLVNVTTPIIKVGNSEIHIHKKTQV